MEDNCTGQPGQWPDASADVPSDRMDEYLAHADECPYHERVLFEEFERELRLSFRAARGLDDHGRILRGDELQQSVSKQEHCVERWEATGRDESPFGLISLYHGGKLIAGSGKFNHTHQQTLHDLDPRVGLQIRARCGIDTGEEVLLGFYALRGVRHDDKEMLLPLDNNYTVGLKVKQLGERSFFVCFRCFETDSIECIELDGEPMNLDALVAPDHKPTRDTQGANGWWPLMPVPAAVLQAGAGFLALCILTFFLVLGFNSATTGANANTQKDGDTRQASNTSGQDVTPARTDSVPSSDPAPIPQEGSFQVYVDASASSKDAWDLRKKGQIQKVIVLNDWDIFSSCHGNGNNIEVKHSGTDPNLKETLHKALAEPDSPCKEVVKPEGRPSQTVYLTKWRINQQEAGEKAISDIELEVHTTSAYSNDYVLKSANLKVPFLKTSGTEAANYERMVENAVNAVCDLLLGRALVLKPPSDAAVQGQAKPTPAQDGGQGKGS